MAKEFSRKFYNSKVWQQCRDGYIASVYGQCERCGEAGLILHHKIVLTPNNINDTNVTLNWDNLEYVCQVCHNTEHMGSHEDVTVEGVRFNELGEVVKDEGVQVC